MSRRKSSFDPEVEVRALESVGEKIALHYGVPLADVRYATYRYRTGDRWTYAAGWERRVDGAWEPEPWLPAAPSTHQDCNPTKGQQER